MGSQWSAEERFCGIECVFPQQDPGHRVLYMLVRDPMKENVTVVQPGGDKGVDRAGREGGGVWRCSRD